MTPLAELQALDERWVMPTYKRVPAAFERGEGAYVWDSEGRRYLDLMTGISVSSVGHRHPAVVEAIRAQSERLLHTSNLFLSEPPLRLAERLSGCSLGGKVFFSNSGAEANECAIKLVRRHAHARGIDRPEIVVLDHAFHGRTLASLAATPRLAKEELFGPLPEGFVVVPRDDPDALRGVVGERTAAVMIEPVQGECGVHPIPNEVVAAAREACDASAALLVFDEIQTGLGRTGYLWAHLGIGIQPDVMTTAKALGGGLPIGACVTTPAFSDVLQPGEHGSTFAGGPLVASAALAVLDIVEDEALLAGVRELGERAAAALRGLPGVSEVRHRGLMIGFDLERGGAPELVERALGEGLVINSTGPETIRLLPPLIIEEAQLLAALEVLGELL